MTQKKSSGELQATIAFAKLEILELDHGLRELHQCPALAKLGRYITSATTAGRARTIKAMSDDEAVALTLSQPTTAGETE